MSPSQQCKEAGLDSFADLVRISGMNENTAHHWYKNKPKQFACMLSGAVAIKYARNDFAMISGSAFLKKWLLLDNMKADDQEIISQLVNRFMED